MVAERRQFIRISFEGKAFFYLKTSTNGCEVKVLDLSLKGALLETPPSIALVIGDTGTLVIQLGALEESITMVVELAYVCGQRIGCQCRNIDLDSVTHLRRLVMMNHGDDRFLERELVALLS